MLKGLLLKICPFLAQQQAARCSIQLHKKCLCWITKSCPTPTGSCSPQPASFYSDSAQVVILNISVTAKPLQHSCRERCWQISIFQQFELARDETSLLACLQATLTSQHGRAPRQYVSERADHELRTWGCPHPLQGHFVQSAITKLLNKIFPVFLGVGQCRSSPVRVSNLFT